MVEAARPTFEEALRKDTKGRTPQLGTLVDRVRRLPDSSETKAVVFAYSLWVHDPDLREPEVKAVGLTINDVWPVVHLVWENPELIKKVEAVNAPPVGRPPKQS